MIALKEDVVKQCLQHPLLVRCNIFYASSFFQATAPHRAQPYLR